MGIMVMLETMETQGITGPLEFLEGMKMLTPRGSDNSVGGLEAMGSIPPLRLLVFISKTPKKLFP